MEEAIGAGEGLDVTELFTLLLLRFVEDMLLEDCLRFVDGCAKLLAGGVGSFDTLASILRGSPSTTLLLLSLLFSLGKIGLGLGEIEVFG